MAKATELRELADAELVNRLGDTKQELFALRFKNATGQLENSSQIGNLKKDVARIEMILREREIAAAGAEETAS